LNHSFSKTTSKPLGFGSAAASGRLVQLLRLTQQTELQAIDDMIVPLRLISGEPQLDAIDSARPFGPTILNWTAIPLW